MDRKDFLSNFLIGLATAPVIMRYQPLAFINGVGTTVGTASKRPVTNTDINGGIGATRIRQIIALADAFKKQLTPDQLAKVQLAYTKADAARWSNFPQALFDQKRLGLGFGDMTERQIGYAKALIKELAGSSVANEGWEEIQGILNADDYLKTLNANGGYGSENYYLAFLGTPANSGKFAIMFGGHHLALQNTYNNGVLTGATPSFRGVEPQGVFNFNSTSSQPIAQEKTAFISLLASLSAAQLNATRMSGPVNDLVAGPQKDNQIPADYAGLRCGDMSGAQKQMVLTAIKTYVHDVAEYTTFLKTYERELDDTYIAWSGNTNLNTRGDYVRIHGPSVWIEWSVQSPVSTKFPHVHSLWRDRLSDYGGN